MAEQALILWPAASLAGLVALTAYPVHALGGLSLPLAILAVRGWRRLRLPAVAGAAAVALITVPGTVYWAREFRSVAADRHNQQLYLSADEDDALDWVSRGRAAACWRRPGSGDRPGTNRAPHLGRSPLLDPRLRPRVSRATALFDGRMPARRPRVRSRHRGEGDRRRLCEPR